MELLKNGHDHFTKISLVYVTAWHPLMSHHWGNDTNMTEVHTFTQEEKIKNHYKIKGYIRLMISF